MKNRPIALLFIGIGLYLIVTFVKSIGELWQAGKKVDEVEQSVVEPKKQNISLKRKLNEVQNQEYIEKVAREKLNMAKPGESIIILPDELQNPKPTQLPPKPLPNWQKWYHLFF